MPAKQISCLPREKPASRRGRTLPRPPSSVQSCESPLPSSLTPWKRKRLLHLRVARALARDLLKSGGASARQCHLPNALQIDLGCCVLVTQPSWSDRGGRVSGCGLE